MKKTSQIALTIVSGLSMQLGFAQTNSGGQTNVNAPDTTRLKNETLVRDTLASTSPRYDTLAATPPQYYFRWHFYDNCYHYCFPRHYYLLTHPHCTREELSHVHYGPRRILTPGNQKVAGKTATASNGTSSPRGGFGHYGTTKSANS